MFVDEIDKSAVLVLFSVNFDRITKDDMIKNKTTTIAAIVRTLFIMLIFPPETCL